VSEAIVLVGGKGTRLSGLFPDIPKVLVPVRGRPFIDHVVDALVQGGVTRVILATGHLHEQIALHFQGRRDVDFVFSVEDRPLGTGGATKQALKLVRGANVLLLNGDSYCPVDFSKLLEEHRRRGVTATLVLAERSGRDDGGNVAVDAEGFVVAFHEKASAQGADWLNAGIYVFEAGAHELRDAPEVCSLERDIVPALVRRRACAAYLAHAAVTDIGTPARYREADKRL
jgi:D-glycero-alpha-D-manno-heptose 1-phosphate guanylyltransferase